MTSRIAVIQMVSSRDVDVSLARAGELIEDAASRKVEAIYLPENFAALASDDPRAIGDGEAGGHGPIRSFLKEISSATGCWIFAGTLPTSRRPDGSPVPDGRVRAASIVYDANGMEVARYDKIHMFDVDVDDNQ
ncbi:MAG: carbon-nitrogen hydrolase family protein, partial [Pseudomonadales bacterium]|nr:carbon-nitrogen hydrolase family protein [Pseudomonadales bacterium]